MVIKETREHQYIYETPMFTVLYIHFKRQTLHSLHAFAFLPLRRENCSRGKTPGISWSIPELTMGSTWDITSLGSAEIQSNISPIASANYLVYLNTLFKLWKLFTLQLAPHCRIKAILNSDLLKDKPNPCLPNDKAKINKKSKLALWHYNYFKSTMQIRMDTRQYPAYYF